MKEHGGATDKRMWNWQEPDVSQIGTIKEFPPNLEEKFDYREDPFAWHYNKFLALAAKDRRKADCQDREAREIYYIRGMILSSLEDNSQLASFKNLRILAMLLHGRVCSWPWVLGQLSWALANMTRLAQSFEENSDIFWLASNANNPKCSNCQLATQASFDGMLKTTDNFNQMFQLLLQPLSKEQRGLVVERIAGMGTYQDWGELLLHHMRYPLPYLKMDFILNQMKSRHDPGMRAKLLKTIESDPHMAKAISEKKIII